MKKKTSKLNLKKLGIKCDTTIEEDERIQKLETIRSDLVSLQLEISKLRKELKRQEDMLTYEERIEYKKFLKEHGYFLDNE